jgi:hypothetical protein
MSSTQVSSKAATGSSGAAAGRYMAELKHIVVSSV